MVPNSIDFELSYYLIDARTKLRVQFRRAPLYESRNELRLTTEFERDDRISDIKVVNLNGQF